MKGKRYTTEDKIRILREADGSKSILEVCRERNISEVTFHRWKWAHGNTAGIISPIVTHSQGSRIRSDKSRSWANPIGSGTDLLLR